MTNGTVFCKLTHNAARADARAAPERRTATEGAQLSVALFPAGRMIFARPAMRARRAASAAAATAALYSFIDQICRGGKQADAYDHYRYDFECTHNIPHSTRFLRSEGNFITPLFLSIITALAAAAAASHRNMVHHHDSTV